MKLTAYDYNAQKWIEGEEARPILLKQYHEDLEILHSDKAERPVKSFVFPCTVDMAKKLTRDCIQELEEMK
jgi:hypothetical protein